MNCPKCGFARPLADQVCRRCKYVFDEGRFLELAPPRAAGGAKAPRFFTRRSWDFLKGYRPGPWLPPVASLVPGLGHLIQQASAQLQTARTFAAVVVLSALAIVLFGLLAVIERRVAWWGPRSTRTP